MIAPRTIIEVVVAVTLLFLGSVGSVGEPVAGDAPRPPMPGYDPKLGDPGAVLALGSTAPVWEPPHFADELDLEQFPASLGWREVTVRRPFVRCFQRGGLDAGGFECICTSGIAAELDTRTCRADGGLQ